MLPKMSRARITQWITSTFRNRSRKRRPNKSRTSAAQIVERFEDRLLLTVNFQFNYTGEPAANTGFNERSGGELTADAQARRDALESIASDFGNLFATDTTLVVAARDWNEPGEGWLAEVNDVFPASTSGFGNRTVAAHKIIKGVDLNNASVDGRLGVNWGENHELDPNDVGSGEDDFYATILHELGHMVGFTAQINNNGSSALGGTKWAPFDQFVADNTGVSLINPSTLTIAGNDLTRWNNAKEGNTNNGLFFNGLNASFVNGGNVPLYSPSSNGGFDISSSVSHVDDDAPGVNFTTHVMVSNGVSGQANAHEFHAVEVGIFKDLEFPYIGPSSLDFGDAPDANTSNGAGNYDTLVASDGPRHIVYPNLKIGSAIDFEHTDATQNAGATGDDNDSDDEDGVVSLLTAAEESDPVIAVNVTNTRGTGATLHGWIDYNGNGVFEASEHASVAVPTGSTASDVNLAFPTVPSGSARNTFARFRLSTDAAAGNPTGLALDGEVEDYSFSISGPITVTTGVDENDGSIDPGTGTGTSLREAIEYANANAGAEIRFDNTVSTILLTSDLFIGANMTIAGPGTSQLAIDAQELSNAFFILDSLTVEISGLTITNGTSTGDGGAILNDGDLTLRNLAITSSTGDFGGAIANYGTLRVVDSSFSNNSATNGGAIFNQGTATIERGTFNANSTTASGGAIANGGELTLLNVTVSGNTANAHGGGIENSANLTIVNSTIVNNQANTDGVGSDTAEGDGGGILTNAGFDDTPSSLTLHNTIVANNSRGGFLSESNDISEDSNNIVVTSQNNLIGVSTGFTGLTNGDNGNLIGSSADLLDPRVAALADNGGPTQTHALLQVSQAIDAGANSAATDNGLVVDQRGAGFDRVNGATVDIGAFEATPHTPMTFTVSTFADESDGDFSDGDFSLREAIEQANLNSGTDTINFATTLNGQTIELSGTGLSITDHVRIAGPGATRLSASGTDTVRPFSIEALADVSISGLRVTDGLGDIGGAIANNGQLTLTQMIVTNSHATVEGGGIGNSGKLNVTSSSITNNMADQFGGGIENRGTVTIANSTLSGNSAAAIGGGMENFGTAKIVNTTIANNRVNSDGIGGGLAGAASRRGSFELELQNTIVADNFQGSGADEVASDLVEFSEQITADSSHNLIGAASLLTTTFVDGDSGNLIGTTETPNPAGLAPLSTIGGFPIHEVQLGSAAIDAGENAKAIDFDGTELTLDQTGFRRVFDGNEDTQAIVDMGPFEYVTRSGAATVNSPTGSSSDATPNFTWTAVALANSYDVIVKNAAGADVIFETVNTTSFTPTDSLPAGTYNVRVRSLREIDGIFINGAFSNSVIFSITVPAIVATETDGTTVVTEAGGTDEISVVLGAQPTNDVTLAVTGSDSSEAIASPESLVFNSDNWNISQTVTVTGQPDDEITDGDVTSTVTIAVDVGNSDAAFSATLPQTISVVTQSHTNRTAFQLMGRGRATDFVTLSSNNGNANLDVELRAPDGTILSPGADGRVSLAGYPAGIYEVWVNDDSGNVDVTPSENLGQAMGEPDAPALDLGGDGEFQFSTDGIILLAYALGSRDSALDAFRAAGDTRSGAEIEVWIQQLADAIDLDGDGGFLFANDGILLLAYALGNRDDSLTAFRGTGATRSASTISTRLDGLFATNQANQGTRIQSPDTSSSGEVLANDADMYAPQDRDSSGEIITLSTSPLQIPDKERAIVPSWSQTFETPPDEPQPMEAGVIKASSGDDLTSQSIAEDSMTSAAVDELFWESDLIATTLLNEL